VEHSTSDAAGGIVRLTAESIEQSRMFGKYQITVTIYNPHLSKIKKLDKEMREILDKIGGLFDE
jgi:hypothetical protein